MCIPLGTAFAVLPSKLLSLEVGLLSNDGVSLDWELSHSALKIVPLRFRVKLESHRLMYLPIQRRGLTATKIKHRW